MKSLRVRRVERRGKRLALVRAHKDVIVRRTDALTRKVLVNMQGGTFNETPETLTRYQFSRWEGGGQPDNF